MRLAHKLSLAQLILICAVLFVHAEVRLKREVRLFETDMRRDHHVTGQALRATVEDAWKAYGWSRASRLVQDADSAEKEVNIAWFWLEGDSARINGLYAGLPPGQTSGTIPSWADSLVQGRDVVRVETRPHGPGDLVTYVPVRIPGAPAGAIRISESLAEEQRFIRSTVVHMLITTTIIAIGAAIISIVLGSNWIVNPMRALVQQARRIGSGDLSMRLGIPQHDEIGMLAREMNAMCDLLQQSDARLRAETGARIAVLEQLRHADRLATVGTLSSGLAHELGTPLNVVSGRAKMIETNPTCSPDAAENARIIREQSERMTRIIRQLLDFARRGVQEKGRGDLRPLTAQVLQMLRPFAEKRRAELVLSDEGSAPACVIMDSDQIRQVLTNLVLNAVQAMPQGGRVTVRVGLTLARPPATIGGPPRECAFVEVEDQGGGIPVENLQRIFDPFFTTKRVGEGTGLGLSVSYGIVREHGGWIEVDSQVDCGSRFRVHLPLAAEDECAEKS